LLRLEAEGLVVREGRGWIVAPINPDEIEELFVYREVLEVAAMRLTMAAPDLNVVSEIEALLDSSGPEVSQEERVRAGMDFHILLAGMSGNTFIREGVAGAMRRAARARWLGTGPQQFDWSEHRAILQAMREGRAEDAVRLVGEHIVRHRKAILELLQQDRRTLRARGLKLGLPARTLKSA